MARRYLKEEKQEIMQEIRLDKNRRAIAAKYGLAESTIRGWEKKLTQETKKSQKDMSYQYQWQQ